MALTDVNGLASSFLGFTKLTHLTLDLNTNGIVDLAPLVGLLDDKVNLINF